MGIGLETDGQTRLDFLVTILECMVLTLTCLRKTNVCEGELVRKGGLNRLKMKLNDLSRSEDEY